MAGYRRDARHDVRGRGTSRSWAADLVVLIVIVEVEQSACPIIECISAMSLRCGACQVQEFELRVRISGRSAGSSHLSVVFRDVAEFIPHAEARSIYAAAAAADPSRLAVVDFADDLVLIHAHLVQLLRLADQQVFAALTDGLRQMLALPGADSFRLCQAASAPDAADAHNAIRSD